MPGTRRHVVVHGPPGAWQRWRLNRRKAIHVNQLEPPVKDLGWLAPWATTLEDLLVTDYSITDISALRPFVNLREITLDTGRLKGDHNRIPFSEFPRLRRFAATWYEVHDDILGSRSVTSLMLDNPPPDIFARTTRMTGLRELDLRDARRVREIPHTGRSRLTHLRIASTRLTEIGGLAGHPDVEILELDGVKGIRDLTPLRAMPGLRRLLLEDCGDIETLTVVGGARLAELYLIGNTNIVDGDLRVVGAGLRRASFPLRDHYNATPTDLMR